MSYKLLIGCHVKMSKLNDYLVGSFQDMINFGGNTFMIYSASPRVTLNKPKLEDMKIDEFRTMLNNNNLHIDNFSIHASYLINLANTLKPSIYDLGVMLLKDEIKRAKKIGIKTLILHPGSSVGADRNTSMLQLAKGINEVLKYDDNIKIALETMAGKGFEIGKTIDELKFIIDNIKFKNKIGVCFDTCHLLDAGYDLKNNFDDFLNEFDKKIGLKKLFVIHLNDSKNIGIDGKIKKDRHENIGYGRLGFQTILKIAYHPKLENIPKILETPYINKKNSPYKEEIAMIKTKKFHNFKNKFN